jgi:hypothetical protein
MTQEQSPGPIEEECLNLAPTPVSNPLDGNIKCLEFSSTPILRICIRVVTLEGSMHVPARASISITWYKIISQKAPPARGHLASIEMLN